MAYWEWGDPHNDKVLMCVHGLTRTGRDFDRLAQALSTTYRVICPDIVGRGRSDWLTEAAYYVLPQYVADIVTLLGRLRAQELHWVGTSMGGLIGMSLAGLPGASAPGTEEPGALPLPPITRMVLNDIGPTLNAEALDRIGQHVNDPVEFAAFDDAVKYVRTVSSAPFGPHSDADWVHLTRYVFRQDGQRWVKHYDPGIGLPFAHASAEGAAAGEAILWRSFQNIQCPTLLVRGELSDLLTVNTAEQMLARNQKVRLAEVNGVGHAPTFMSPDQIRLVADFLGAT